MNLLGFDSIVSEEVAARSTPKPRSIPEEKTVALTHLVGYLDSL